MVTSTTETVPLVLPLSSHFFTTEIHFKIVVRDAILSILVQKVKRILRDSGRERLADKTDDSGLLESAVGTTSSWFASYRVLFVCDDLWQTFSSRSEYYQELHDLVSR